MRVSVGAARVGAGNGGVGSGRLGETGGAGAVTASFFAETGGGADERALRAAPRSPIGTTRLLVTPGADDGLG